MDQRFERILNLEPDPQLMEIQAEIDHLEMRIRELRQVGLPKQTWFLASSVLSQVLSSGLGLHVDNPVAEEMNAKVTEQAECRERIEELRSRLDPRYARRLAETRERAKRMQRLLDILYPPQHNIFQGK